MQKRAYAQSDFGSTSHAPGAKSRVYDYLELLMQILIAASSVDDYVCDVFQQLNDVNTVL